MSLTPSTSVDSPPEPGTILCATRGGPASHRTQDVAIALAKAQAAEIVFVYVADARFVDFVSSAVLVDMEEQMEDLGEFLLLMAKERAERAGVRARTVVRSGRFRDALAEEATANNSTTIILGRPGEEGSVVKGDYLDKLRVYLHQETGADVRIV